MSHYFQLNNIYICNLKGIPWFSKDISQKVVKFTSDFNEILRHEETLKDDEKLNILFIQNTYGYRSGIFGFATEFVADGLTSLFISTPPMKLQSFLNHNVDYFRQNNLQCNDFQIISGAISYLNRFIPFANYFKWDIKNDIFFDKLNHETRNDSIPSIFDTKKVFDNGIRLHSNKKPTKSGFVPLVTQPISLLDTFAKRGIEWFYFQETNCSFLCLVYNFSDNNDDIIKKQEFYQLITLYKELYNLLTKSCDDLDVLIIGDIYSIDKDDFIDFQIMKCSPTSNCHVFYKSSAPQIPGVIYTDDYGLIHENYHDRIFDDISLPPLSPVEINNETRIDDTYVTIVETTTNNIIFTENCDKESVHSDEWTTIV